MPRVDPGYNKPKKKRYVPKPRPYSHQGGDRPVTSKTKLPAAPPTKSPAGDTHKDAGARKAETFKRTSPKYTASIRAGYRAGKTADRQQQVDFAKARDKGTRSIEETAILEAHRQRHAYDLKKLKEIGFLPRVRYAEHLKKYQEEKYAENVRHAGGVPNYEQVLTPKQRTARTKEIARLAKTPSKSYGRSGILGALPLPQDLMKRAAALVEATYHDPIGVPVKTGKQAVLAVPAAATGAVELVTHPVKSTRKMAEDISTRNDESYEDKVKRIRKEGGFEDASDLAMALSPASAATSAAARAALLGKMGERAAIRTSGGIVRGRPKAGLTRTVIGRTVDNARGRRLARDLKVARAGGRSMDALRYKAATANERAGKTVQVVTKSVKSQQRRAVASERGKSVYRLRQDQKYRLDAVKRQINRLDKHEKAAFWYAAALGIRHSTPVENKLTLLSNLRDDIVAGRESANIQDIKGSMKRSDMLPDLDRIIADVDKHFTPKLSEVVENMRPESRKAAIEDPRLVARQANERRWAPLAQLLKTRRGEHEDTASWNYIPPERAQNGAKPDATIDGSLAELTPDGRGLPNGQLQLPRISSAVDDMPSWDEFYANVPKASRTSPTPTVEALTRNVKPGKPGISIDSVHISQVDRVTKEHVGWGREMPGEKVVVYRDADGKPIGALQMLLDADGKPDMLQVAVDPGHQGKGIATKLYQYAQEHGFDVNAASGEGGYTKQGARLAYKRLRAKKQQERQAAAADLRGAPAARPDQSSGPLSAWSNGNKADESIPHAGFYEEVPGQRYNPDETRAQYRQRLIKEAKAQGLAKPLYFKSERYVGPTDFAARALGGRRAMKDDFRYTGENMRVGLQDTSPDQYMRGLARNIKAKHNWESIARLIDDHAITGLTSPLGTTVSDLRKSVYEAGIDEGSVVYWNPGIFRDKAREVDADIQAGDAAAQQVPGRELSTDTRAQELAPDAHDAALTRAAMKDAVIGDVHGGGAKKITTPAHLAKTSGWQVVPVEVMREIERQTTPSRAAARVLDVAKGKASRAILLTGNVPWAAFQVASNTAMTAAATGGRALNPANWLGASKWWHELSHEERNRIGAEIGLDTAGADYSKTHLGASTNSDVVNTYRAMKAHPVWHTGLANGRGPTISQLNPLELMAAFDRKQNNAARINTAFANLKKEAVRDMGRNMGRADKAQAKLTGILGKKNVRDQVSELAKNPKLLEEHADAIHDWLGDYTSMTSFERQVLNRTIMFYPYLRYSLKLTFYTMPMKHPIMTSILAELGSMRADELKELLGGDRLYWNTGKVYFGSGGDVKEIDLRRANPALNALWDVAGSGNSAQLLGSLPPYAQWAIDQLVHRSTYADREWRTEGKAAEYGKKGSDYGSALRALQPGTTRNRILVGSVARLFYPYREAVKRSDSMQGVQGDDSLLGAPRPIAFKGRTYASKLKAQASKKQAAFDKENRPGWAEGLVPFLPQPTRDFEAAKDQAKIKRAEDHPPKKRKKNKYFGSS